MTTTDTGLFSDFRAGAPRAIIEASLKALADGEHPALAIVLETDGSTYVRAGAIALFSAQSGQTGWLSGGCLEPEIAARAASSARFKRIEWMEIDTRDDEDLFLGSAVGCRGRLRLALFPLAVLDGWRDLAQSWLTGEGDLLGAITAKGELTLRIGSHSMLRQIAAAPVPWIDDSVSAQSWSIEISTAPSLLVMGAGPETALLIPTLRSMGWMVCVIDRRPRWSSLAALADVSVHESPAIALGTLATQRFTAALVMHHNFELDREALVALADSAIPFIGLLGPNRRREDLFKLMSAGERERLSGRMRSPVGIDLGGRGPEAIALSIVAQLHAHLHGH